MGGKNIYLWSTISRVGSQTLGFIGNILIARQLSPDDYGLVAMLAIILGVSWNLTDSGFADCLIRRINADKKDFGTVLSFNVGISILMFLIITVIAPMLAKFFGREELINIARVLGLSIVIKSISLTEITRLRKELQFKKIAIIQISSISISIIIAYILALNSFGYWALVSQTISISVSYLILITIISHWRPYFYFSVRRFKEMSGFSFNLLLSYISYQLGSNLYSFFIGKFHSAYSLGFYRQAQKLEDAPIKGLNAIILTTTYPLLAQTTDENKRYQMYIVLLNRFLFLQFLICMFLIGSAYPFIEILFSEKWINSAPFFQLMIIAYLFYPLTTLNYNIAKIYNQAKLYRNLTFMKNGLSVLALILTMHYSIYIILYGQIIAYYISVLLDIMYCGPIINFGLTKQLMIALRNIWIPILSMVMAYIASLYTDILFIKLVLYSVAFFLTFFIINEITKQQVYIDFKTLFFSYLRKLIKR